MALLGGDVDEIALAGALMGHGLAGAQHPNGGVLAVAGYLGGGDHHGSAAVGDDAAVVQVEGRGDHTGAHHVRDGYLVAEQGLGVHGSVVADGHSDLGELLRGGAELVHVPLGDHGVQSHGGQAVQFLEAVGRRIEARVSEPSHAARAYGDAAGAGQRGVGDDGNVDAPGVDGVEGVGQVELEGASAHGGVVDVLGVHVQVIGEVQTAVSHRHGGGEQAVDIVLGQPGVFEGLDDALALYLELALVWGVTGYVFVDTDDRGGASQVNHGQDTSGVGWGETQVSERRNHYHRGGSATQGDDEFGVIQRRATSTHGAWNTKCSGGCPLTAVWKSCILLSALP